MEIFSSGVQYDDIKGNISIDGHMGNNLHEFARANNIDTDKYFPIGIDIYIGELGNESVSIIAIDEEQIGLGSKYDNIKDYITSNEIIDVKRFDLDGVTLADYIKTCKRFHIAASSIPELMNKHMNIF